MPPRWRYLAFVGGIIWRRKCICLFGILWIPLQKTENTVNPAIHMSVFSWNFASPRWLCCCCCFWGYQGLDVPMLKEKEYGNESQRSESFQSAREPSGLSFPATIGKCFNHVDQMVFTFGCNLLYTERLKNVVQTSRENQGLRGMSSGLAFATNFLCGFRQTTLPHKASVSPPLRWKDWVRSSLNSSLTKEQCYGACCHGLWRRWRYGRRVTWSFPSIWASRC